MVTNFFFILVACHSEKIDSICCALEGVENVSCLFLVITKVFFLFLLEFWWFREGNRKSIIYILKSVDLFL
uniref:Secreted protein n=1 Tax=Strongyloides venezuelensis TaxID=75913 RepID=A0A0K0FFD1_STRVS